MNKKIKFKKNRILLGILFFSLMLFASIWFLINPEIFLRNVFMKAEFIQTMGIIGIVYFPVILFSFFKIISRKYAIVITDDFIIDNSKYESLGKIKWKDISEIQRFKKKNIELILNKTIFKTKRRNLLKRFLTFMHNWNYKKSILISSALMDCSIEELFETISLVYEQNRLK